MWCNPPSTGFATILRHPFRGRDVAAPHRALCPSERCGRYWLYNKAWERPRNRVWEGSISVASVGWPSHWPSQVGLEAGWHCLSLSPARPPAWDSGLDVRSICMRQGTCCGPCACRPSRCRVGLKSRGIVFTSLSTWAIDFTSRRLPGILGRGPAGRPFFRKGRTLSVVRVMAGISR